MLAADVLKQQAARDMGAERAGSEPLEQARSARNATRFISCSSPCRRAGCSPEILIEQTLRLFFRFWVNHRQTIDQQVALTACRNAICDFIAPVGFHLARISARASCQTILLVQADYFVRRCFRLDAYQGDHGLKENGQHRKRNRAAAITMEAAIKEPPPLRVLK
jgi:hypothetical protein